MVPLLQGMLGLELPHGFAAIHGRQEVTVFPDRIGDVTLCFR